MRRPFLCFLVAGLLAAIAPACGAAPFAAQVGDMRVNMDAPPGFADTNFTGSPRLQELAESLTSASNRILLFAVSDADLRRFMQGDPPELRRYMIAVTPGGLEREHVTRRAFSSFVNDSLRDLGKPPADADYVKFLAAQPAGQAALLAELRKDPDVVSVLQGAKIVPPQGSRDEARYLASTTTLLLIRGKALNVSVFTAYDTPQDLDWLRITTTRWVEELQRLNNR